MATRSRGAPSKKAPQPAAEGARDGYSDVSSSERVAGAAVCSEWSKVTPCRLTHLLSLAAMGTAVAGAVWAWRGRLVRSACPSLPLTGSSASVCSGMHSCRSPGVARNETNDFSFVNSSTGLLLKKTNKRKSKKHLSCANSAAADFLDDGFCLLSHTRTPLLSLHEYN